MNSNILLIEQKQKQIDKKKHVYMNIEFQN